MEVKFAHRPGNAAARILLGPNQSCVAESGTMIAMSGDMGLTTTTHKKSSGSFFKAIKRMLTGESFFLNHFTAGGSGGEVWVASTLPGDMMQFKLDGANLIVQGGSFIAADSAVELDMSWQGFKSFFSGEWVFWIRASGAGSIVLSSYGCIYPVQIDGEYIVDGGHIVAFQDSLSFSISKAGKSWLGSMMGGEGFVCRFQGKGTLWCQSHNPQSFGKLLGPMLRPREQ